MSLLLGARTPQHVADALKIVNDWCESPFQQKGGSKKGLIFQIKTRDDLAKGW